MKVRVLGGHGGRSPEFNTTSYLIDDHLLIDAGSVATGLTIKQQQQVNNILISHAHLDHICEMAYLVDNCYGTRTEPFQVYSDAKVKESILKHFFNDEIWPDFTKIPFQGRPTIEFNEHVSEKTFQLADYLITPVRVNHPNGACGYIIEQGGQSLVFTVDTGPTDRIWELAAQSKNLVAIFAEASFPNSLQEVAKSSQHNTPHDLQMEIKKMPPIVPVYIAHIKPNYQTQMVKELEDLKNDRIITLTKDGVTFQF